MKLDSLEVFFRRVSSSILQVNPWQELFRNVCVRIGGKMSAATEKKEKEKSRRVLSCLMLRFGRH